MEAAHAHSYSDPAAVRPLTPSGNCLTGVRWCGLMPGWRLRGKLDGSATHHARKGPEPMPIPSTCPNCHARASAPDAAAGRLVTCPRCRAKFRVPVVVEEVLRVSPPLDSVPPPRPSPKAPAKLRVNCPK